MVVLAPNILQTPEIPLALVVEVVVLALARMAIRIQLVPMAVQVAFTAVAARQTQVV
jgi:hypothetical protein